MYIGTGFSDGQFKMANQHPTINLPLSGQCCWKTVLFRNCRGSQPVVTRTTARWFAGINYRLDFFSPHVFYLLTFLSEKSYAISCWCTANGLFRPWCFHQFCFLLLLSPSSPLQISSLLQTGHHRDGKQEEEPGARGERNRRNR